MLGWSVASKMIYVRPAGSPEATRNKGKIQTLTICVCDPLDSHPNSPPGLFVIKIIYGTFLALRLIDGWKLLILASSGTTKDPKVEGSTSYIRVR